MKSEPVSRLRRALFVFSVVGFTLGGALYLAMSGREGKVVEIVADGFITISLALSISYVAGTSIDYSGVLSRIGGKGVVASQQPAPPAPEPDDEPEPKQKVDPEDAKG